MPRPVQRSQWEAVVKATTESSRADCGHPTGHRRIANVPVWLRTETAGDQVEVYSVCPACATEDDYHYIPGTSQPPTRTLHQSL